MKHDSRKTYSGRFTDSVRAKFNEISEQFPDYTDSQIVEEIVNQCAANVHTDNSAVIAELQSKLEDLKAERENLVSINGELSNKIEELTTECEQWKQTANENGVGASAKDAEVEKLQNEIAILKKQLEASLTPGKGQYVVNLEPMADELIQVTVNRLREKFAIPELTPSRLLADLFVKYTAKRPANFAYPFVISKDEFNVIMSKYSK